MSVHQVLVAFLVLLGAACSKAPPPRATEPPLVAERTLADSLATAIGDPLCKADADCWLLPVGKKPCGGPRTYTVSSVRGADSLRVIAWAESLAMQERTRNLSEGRMSDCSMVTPPTVRCVGGRCGTSAVGR